MKPNGHWHSEHERLTLEALEGLQGQSPPPQIAPKIADRVHGDAPASPDGLLSALKRLPWWAIFYGGLVLGLALNHRACSP